MTKMEVQLIKDYINLAVGDLKEVVISSTGDMKNSIDEMNQTLKTHNGRLGKVEAKQEQYNRITYWMTKRWYVLLLVLILLILLLIPVVDALGLSGLVKLYINTQITDI